MKRAGRACSGDSAAGRCPPARRRCRAGGDGGRRLRCKRVVHITSRHITSRQPRRNGAGGAPAWCHDTRRADDLLAHGLATVWEVGGARGIFQLHFFSPVCVWVCLCVCVFVLSRIECKCVCTLLCCAQYSISMRHVWAVSCVISILSGRSRSSCSCHACVSGVRALGWRLVSCVVVGRRPGQPRCLCCELFIICSIY